MHEMLFGNVWKCVVYEVDCAGMGGKQCRLLFKYTYYKTV